MADYFDSATGKLIDVAEKEIKRTDEMVVAQRGDLRLGQLVYIMSSPNSDKVLPHRIRGKIQSDKRMRFINWKDEEEWSCVEPDWSYNDYRRTIAKMLEMGVILIHQNDQQKMQRNSPNV